MCLGIPGEVVELMADHEDLAMVSVEGVKRAVNIGLLREEAGGALRRGEPRPGGHRPRRAAHRDVPRAGHEAVRARRYGEARRMLELARALQMPRVSPFATGNWHGSALRVE